MPKLLFLFAFFFLLTPQVLAEAPEIRPCASLSQLELSKVTSDVANCPINSCFVILGGDIAFCNIPIDPNNPTAQGGKVPKCTDPDPKSYSSAINLIGSFCIGSRGLCYFDTGISASNLTVACQPKKAKKPRSDQPQFEGINKVAQEETPTCSPADEAAGKCTSSEEKKCKTGQTETALGCISAQPQALMGGFLRLATLIGGGIALLLMIRGSVKMITSAGDVERIKEGKDQFISAIIGLMIVIFAVFLMQVAGVDILNIPGFSR